MILVKNDRSIDKIPIKLRGPLLETLQHNARNPRYAPTVMFERKHGELRPKNPLAKALCKLIRLPYLPDDLLEVVLDIGFNIEVRS
jgi:hypothetical protein